jgi:hypothetical protein
VGIQVVGDKVFVDLRPDRVEVVLGVIPRNLSIPKKEVVAGNAMRAGIHSSKQGGPRWIGKGGKHRHGLPHGGAFCEDDAIGAGTNAEQIV